MSRIALLMLVLFPVTLWADDAQPVTLTTQEDHQRMMKLLGIKELRKGRNGMDKNHPKYANYDESMANPYPKLPDPLKALDGRVINTQELWWNVRRPELVEIFDR